MLLRRLCNNGRVHIPDGFIDPAVSAGAGVLAAGAVAVSLRAARRELDDFAALLAGLVAVFVFAAQMVNFPVGAGTSGHLIGGALAAILVGPATAVLAMTVVLLVQAVFFADGGLTALGLNVLNLAVVAPLVGYAVFRGVVLLARSKGWSVPVAAFLAGLLSTVAAALAFAGEFALGGTEAVPAGTVTMAMVGVHLVIGVAEGIITALVVGAVLAVRPDLVRGLRPRRSESMPVAAQVAA
jgi:cobalt/nickel transport system permease protein